MYYSNSFVETRAQSAAFSRSAGAHSKLVVSASCASMLVMSTLACCELPACCHCQHAPATTSMLSHSMLVPGTASMLANSMLVMLVCQHAGHVSPTTIFWL